MEIIYKCLFSKCMTQKNTKRFILTLSPYLKDKLERVSVLRGCSQAEVVKTAIIELEDGS